MYPYLTPEEDYAGTLTEVFNINGRLVFSGMDGIVCPIPKGIYVIKTSDEITKIIL